MDDAEKRRLKKLGKKLVEQRSDELRAKLTEANPAPIGSDDWARNYKAQTLREKELQQSPPDCITAADAKRDFVLNEVDPGENFSGVRTWYIECPKCLDLLHSIPQKSVMCRCRGVKLDLANQKLVLEVDLRPRIIVTF